MIRYFLVAVFLLALTSCKSPNNKSTLDAIEINKYQVELVKAEPIGHFEVFKTTLADYPWPQKEKVYGLHKVLDGYFNDTAEVEFDVRFNVDTKVKKVIEEISNRGDSYPTLLKTLSRNFKLQKEEGAETVILALQPRLIYSVKSGWGAKYDYSMQFKVTAYKGSISTENLMGVGVGTIEKHLINGKTLLKLVSDSKKVAAAINEAIEDLEFVK